MLARRGAGALPAEGDQTDASEPLLVDRNPTPEQGVLIREQARTALEAIASAPLSAQRLFRLLHARAGQCATPTPPPSGGFGGAGPPAAGDT